MANGLRHTSREEQESCLSVSIQTQDNNPKEFAEPAQSSLPNQSEPRRRKRLSEVEKLQDSLNTAKWTEL